AGTFTVALTATNAQGSNTNTKVGFITVTAPPAPTADFSATPTSGNVPLAVNFTDLSTGAPTSWAWTFGDGATSTLQNPSHTYTGAGTFTVALTATNAQGSNTNTKVGFITVTAPPAPTADFSATPTSGNVPLAVNFTDLSTGAPTSWAWTFGDGATSTLQNPSHTYSGAGTFTVALTATNAQGSNTNTKVGFITVTSPPAPTAEFSASPTSGNVPLAVNFTDLSTGAPTSWAWTFGDGATSTLQNPSHTYSVAGSFTVALTATNAQGSNTNTKVNFVTVTSGPPAGEGFILSKNADFSTDDRTFFTTDVIHMMIFSDVIDFNDNKKRQWDMQSGGGATSGDLTNNLDGTYTFSLAVSSLPGASTSWDWSARVEDKNGNRLRPSAVVTITTGSLGISATQKGFNLLQNYPNPFNPTTEISFSVGHAENVELTVYNVMGQVIKTLVDRSFAPGSYTVTWNGVDDNGAPVASGMYFYRIKAGEFVLTRKMALLK
ncbi:MAG: PKD domain-containing protein, partial [candidate division Zixibacteria bacterium]|nr:PKD domain-containing protein [candidate division Zixibacteria bacterium]